MPENVNSEGGRKATLAARWLSPTPIEKRLVSDSCGLAHIDDVNNIA